MRYLSFIVALIPSTLGSYQLSCETYQYPVVSPKEIRCLATMIYGEARGETARGKVAVAYTAVNRAAKTTVCNVILAPWQYSAFNDNNLLRAVALNHSLEPSQKNPIDRASWFESLNIAHLVLHRAVPDPTGGASHYIADKVMKIKKYRYPKWSKQYTQVAVIDNHRFFKPNQASKNKKHV